MRVGDHMRSPAITIAVQADLSRALQIMRSQRIRHLPVVDGGKLVGIISDRDLRLSMVEVEGPASGGPKDFVLPSRTPIRNVMRAAVLTATTDTPIREASRVMAENKIGCLPVVDGEDSRKVIGIITETDMLRILVKVLDRET